MLKEKDIAHENGDFWVLSDKQGFHVMRSGLTNSTCDSAYATLDLAIARCDYLAKTVTKK
ncbi:hypothetical protein N275_gp39 [Salmonella phage FSL SP-031]|uniref:Uncharacterized protein n=1 Tax=Salmonella phage FSL SP-031 TaxID=1173749 RepID=S4TSY7_9CAUD|nr:hypothetical protein N275_gp39 [Salmonella phage FSL SP-031]AGF88240.1 hypothetical protein SP031_00195 [Salmonella phage FSL SP-031]